MDAITDDSNLWLRATRTQDSGDHLGAFSLYISDATNCLERNSLSRTALSCSCAADCLLQAGMEADARSLFRESARLYEMNSELAVGASVRESLWSLLQSYDHFLLAGDERGTERVNLKYISLARRTNPIDGESDALQVIRARKYGAHVSEAPDSLVNDDQETLNEVRKSIAKFAQLIAQFELNRGEHDQLPEVPAENAGAVPIEGSIVS